MEMHNLEEWARARQTESVLAFRRARLSGLTFERPRPRRRGTGYSQTTTPSAGPPAIPREAA